MYENGNTLGGNPPTLSPQRRPEGVLSPALLPSDPTIHREKTANSPENTARFINERAERTGPLVMKFGGTSVADAERIMAVASLARNAAKDSSRGVLVVLSAVSKATDALFRAAKLAASGETETALAELDALLGRHRDIAAGLFDGMVPYELETAFQSTRHELGAVLRGASMLGEIPSRALDLVAGRGELLSSRLLASFLGAAWIDARAVMRTDSTFGEAAPDRAETARLAREAMGPRLEAGEILVTQGYVGSDPSGIPTTLGRGGSDFSASIFGAALGASEIQIWTDVEGILTCDPRVVPGARPVERLGYEEAAELAAFGAKVLHPATILPAVEAGIPVTVRDSRFPLGRFSTISGDSSSGLSVTALASRGRVTTVTVRSPGLLGGVGFLARIFAAFGSHGIPVDVVSTSEVAVSMTVEGDADLGPLLAELKTFAETTVSRDRSIIAVVGDCLRRTPGVPGTALGALRGIPIEMISLSANEINLSLVVESRHEREALRLLHEAFFPKATAGREAS